MKKKLFLIILLLMIIAANAQMTNTFYYEAGLYTSDGFAIPGYTISVKAELHTDYPSGGLAYAETHQVKTKTDGTYSLIIGKGDHISGAMDEVPWGQKKIWLCVYVDKNEGSGYQKIQESELLPVPYALYAGGVQNYWQKNGKNLFYNDGNIGIKTSNPSEALEIGVNGAVRLSTTKTWLSESGLVKLMWANKEAKPAIAWYDAQKKPIAALYAYQDGLDGETDSTFSVGTSDAAGKIVPRFNIPWGHDRVTITTKNADFKVSDGYKFIVGSKNGSAKTYFYGDVFVQKNKRLGIGDKDWENNGFTGDAAMEVYRRYSNSSILINQPTGVFAAQLTLQSGDSRWDIQSKERLSFIHNYQEKFTITEAGNVGIGVSDPDEKLVVDGNIRIPAGAAFITGNKGMATYFENEEPIEPGNAVGLNQHTGKVRNYKPGDELMGIATTSAGFISNCSQTTKLKSNYTLVCYKGQTAFNQDLLRAQNRLIMTADGKKIGVRLANGDIFIQ
jgi:hypothetical protein